MTQTVTMTIISDGRREERPRIDLYVAARASHGVPAWIRDRPLQGGQGGLMPAEASKGAIWREIVRQGYINRAALVKADSQFEEWVGVSEYCGNTEATRALVRAENAERACNIIRGWMRRARLCPVSQLDSLMEEALVQAEVYSRLSALGIGAHTHALSVACETAAETLLDRLVNET